jgi:hypothetical protein
VGEAKEAMGGKARVGLSQGLTRTLDELTPVLDRHKGQSVVIGGLAVIYKAIAWRPQDQQDVERLLVLHGARMDLTRIRQHVRELGEAMEQDRLRELEIMFRRVLGP